ncbi:hypothetical protein SASPL_126442 [Salvia splendens]|uniref:Uncharacterized protein n=1 Tax=Salvia splendens TaxID=180675 RepID=A0A8X8ZR05_SALSN|nr:hypothetical protein SASPL_126442 [Salvia splendens]
MKRVDLIKEIAAEFELIANRLSETEVATVASVVELEPQHLAEIAKRAQKLTGPKNVKLKTVIDKSLLAGIIIRYGNSGSKLSLITLRLLNVFINLPPPNRSSLPFIFYDKLNSWNFTNSSVGFICIPYKFSNLQRLKKFSVANNDLLGRLPSFNSGLELNFGGNSFLCGGPAGKYGCLSKKSLAIIIAAGIFGVAASLLLGFDLWWWYFTGSGKRRKGGCGI